MLQTEDLSKVIPAPLGTRCPRSCCRRRISPTDRHIVRYNGYIYHLLCFQMWMESRKREARNVPTDNQLQN
jgi:hypothetical protein